MTERERTDDGLPSPSFGKRIDSLCNTFEAAWKSGQRPLIESFLAKVEGPDRSALLCALLKVDSDYRLRAGETPSVDAYKTQLPEDGETIESVFRLSRKVEKPARKSSHGRQSEQQAPARPRGLHVRCPHCNNPIEIVEEDDSLANIECPSCGSSFSLLGEKTETYFPGDTKKIAHFELIDCLGSGAFGSVWMARDTELDRTVAIKIPRKGQLSPEETDLFLREARAAAQLKHPNIVSIHEVGRHNETVYIVSDFVRGANLSDWLTGQQPSARESAQLCATMAEALHHSHELGVIHRDLKPANVMMDPDGQPHIMDFGLAKRDAGEVTMTVEGRVLGTPAYMSPEQARGEGHHADRRSDVYSLGVILFQFLTGELPFRGNPRMLIYQVINEEPRSPRSLNDRVPRDLETICQKAMAKEPHRRYESALVMADDLRRYLASEPIQARPVGRIRKVWWWTKRQPVVAGLSAALIVSLVAGTAISSYFAVSAARREQEAVVERNRAVTESRRANEAREKETAERERANENAEDADLARQEAERTLRVALIGKVREQSLTKQVGWTRDASIDLDRALSIDTPGGESATLRSLMATCLTSADLVVQRDLVPGELVFCLAFDPASERLAIAQYKGPLLGITSKVWIVNVATGEIMHELVIPHGVAPVPSSPSGGRAVGFSPDGEWLLVGTRYGKIYAWDITRPIPTVRYWQAHDGDGPMRIAFDHDATAFYSVIKDGSVKRWNISAIAEVEGACQPEPTAVAQLPDQRSSLSIAPQRCVVTAGNSIQWLDRHSLEPIRDMGGGEATALRGARVTYVGSGEIVAIEKNRDVLLYEAQSGKLIRQLVDPTIGKAHGPTAKITQLESCSDGSLLISSDNDGHVKLWDVLSGNLLVSLFVGAPEHVYATISSDGKYLATTFHSKGKRHVKLYRINGRTFQGVIGLQAGAIRALDTSQKGQLATLARYEDGQKPAVNLWNLDTGRLLRTYTGRHRNDDVDSPSVALAPDGSKVAHNGPSKSIHVWDALLAKKPFVYDAAQARELAFSHDGRRLYGLVGSSDLGWWNPTDGRFEKIFSNRVSAILTGRSRLTCLAVGAKFLAVGSDDRSLKLVSSGGEMQSKSIPMANQAVASVSLTQDETLAACGTYGGKVFVVRIPTGEKVAQLDGHHDRVNSVDFAPSGLVLASGASDGQICLWHWVGDTFEQFITLSPKTGPVSWVRFSHDGRSLISFIEGESALRVWHLDRLRNELQQRGLARNN